MITQEEINTLAKLEKDYARVGAKARSLEKHVNNKREELMRRFKEQEEIQPGAWAIGINVVKQWSNPFKKICQLLCDEVTLQAHVDEHGYVNKERLVILNTKQTKQKTPRLKSA